MTRHDPDTIDSMIAWALSRIDHCRREEEKFMAARPHRHTPKGEARVAGPDDVPQAVIEAVQERQTLTAVMEQLGVKVPPHALSCPRAGRVEGG